MQFISSLKEASKSKIESNSTITEKHEAQSGLEMKPEVGSKRDSKTTINQFFT